MQGNAGINIDINELINNLSTKIGELTKENAVKDATISTLARQLAETTAELDAIKVEKSSGGIKNKPK